MTAKDKYQILEDSYRDSFIGYGLMIPDKKSSLMSLRSIILWDDEEGGWYKIVENFVHDFAKKKTKRRIKLINEYDGKLVISTTKNILEFKGINDLINDTIDKCNKTCIKCGCDVDNWDSEDNPPKCEYCHSKI